MAEGEIRIADMTASSGLTSDDNFVVDKAGSNGTKKFSAADYIANKAELTDIRVGADGTTYPSAGDAVRATENKTNLTLASGNIFDKTNIIEGKVLSISNGTMSNNSVCGVSDFIEIKPNDYIYFNKNINSSYYGNCFYTKDKVFISGYPSNEANKTVVAPNNAYYLRVTFLLSTKDNFIVFNRSLLKDMSDELVDTSKKTNLFYNSFVSDNIISEGTITEGKGIYYNGTAVYETTNANLYEFRISVKPDSVYLIKNGIGYNSIGLCYAVYDASGQPIARVDSIDNVISDNTQIKTPQNASFMIITGEIASKNSQEIRQIEIDSNYIETKDSYKMRYDTVMLKGKTKDLGGFPYVAFSGGCILNGKETYVSRFGKQHTTPSSRSDWGKLGFITRDINGVFGGNVLFPDLDYDDLDAELRDPNLTPTKDNKFLLSGFATNNESATPIYYSYIYLLDNDLSVIDKIVFETDYLFWGNTLITPDGYLLHCAYSVAGVVLMRSTIPFNGEDFEDLSFEVVQNLGLTNESTVFYWNSKLVIIGRALSWTDDAVLFESENLEGTGTFTNHTIDCILHAPTIKPINNGEYLLVSGSKVTNTSNNQREPWIGVLDSNYNVVSEKIIEHLTGQLNGYNTLIPINNSDFGVMFFHDPSYNNQTELYFKQININYLLNTSYYNI